MKKDKPMEQLQNFEKIKLSDDKKSGKSLNSKDSSKVNLSEDISDWSSICSSSSEWKSGSDENFIICDISRVNKNRKLDKTIYTCLDDYINDSFNYESIRSRLVSHSKNQSSVENGKSEDLIPIVFGTIVRNVLNHTDNKNLKIRL